MHFRKRPINNVLHVKCNLKNVAKISPIRQKTSQYHVSKSHAQNTKNKLKKVCPAYLFSNELTKPF